MDLDTYEDNYVTKDSPSRERPQEMNNLKSSNRHSVIHIRSRNGKLNYCRLSKVGELCDEVDVSSAKIFSVALFHSIDMSSSPITF